MDQTTTQPQQPTPGTEQQQPGHHSERQPRAQGQFAGAPKPEDQHAAGQQAKQMFRVKWTKDRESGQVVEEDLDEQTLANRLAAANGFHRKAEEAAKLRKELDSERQQRAAALSDPKNFRQMVLSEMERSGVDKATATQRVKDLLTDTLHGFLAEEAEDPKDRELRELREREQERQNKEKESKSKEELEATRARIREKGVQMATTLGEALKAAKNGGLPMDETTLRVMGQHYLRNLKHGINCTPQELVAFYEEDLDRDVGARTANLSYSQIKARYPQIVRAIAKGLREEARASKGRGGEPRQAPARSHSGGPQGLEERGPSRPPSYSGSDPNSWRKLQQQG